MSTASDFFALVNGTFNSGQESCHYCGSKCDRKWVHDDPPPIPFKPKKPVTALCPNNLFICTGCWLYRRQRITVNFLKGGLKDRQALKDYSWLMTRENIWVVTQNDYPKLYEILLKPPLQFCLSLLDGQVENFLQMSVVSEQEEIKKDTPLSFTLDNVSHTYSVYELEEGLKNGAEGKMPGVRALIKLLGSYSGIEVAKKEPQKGAGRPFQEDNTMVNKTRSVVQPHRLPK